MEIDFQSVSVITDKSFPVIDTWYNKYTKRCQTQHQQYTHQNVWIWNCSHLNYWWEERREQLGFGSLFVQQTQKNSTQVNVFRLSGKACRNSSNNVLKPHIYKWKTSNGHVKLINFLSHPVPSFTQYWFRICLMSTLNVSLF